LSQRFATQTGVEEGCYSTMSDPLIEDYLRWLAPQIRETWEDQTYWELMGVMFEKKFDEVVPHDRNRMVDGLGLRREFCQERYIPTTPLDVLGECSFLEVLIGLSRRLSFAAGGKASDRAWQLITNLELNRMSDPLSRYKSRKANDILDRCIMRDYPPNGQGGFFPLAWADEDQRQVELWYQMAAYIDELHPGN
jgi:hypothetical protein